MSSTSIYRSLAPTWPAPYKSTEVTLRYRVPFFNKSLFEVWRVCGVSGRPQTLLLSLSHSWLVGFSSGLTAGHSSSWMFSCRKTVLVMHVTWALALSCMSKNWGPTPYAVTNTCCNSIRCIRRSKITTADDKIRTAINTDATSHHHTTSGSWGKFS